MRVAQRSRFVATVLLVLGATLARPEAASAAPYAAIVMDMRDGRVLHSRSADRKQHPASLTKMMTLYLTFEALQQGRLQLDQKVTVSRHAASMPRSKLYLKRGQRVSIRHLIRATAVKSANDAAMVLAEAIGGSQAGFAKMMTDKARALGMTRSTFKNPHGLTQRGHLSTARDMALLARRLYFDFPQYYNVFGKTRAYAAGKRIRTTNGLLASYRGAEGMKTGYTRAAGYNLVGVAKRGSKRVIAVVLGGKSTRTRNREVARLLDMGFDRARTHVAEVRPQAPRAAVVLASASPLPVARPGAGRAGPTGLAAIGAALAPAAEAALVAELGSAYAPLYGRPPQARPGTALAAGDPRWSVRVGTFDDRTQAIESVTAVTLGDVAPLASAPSEIKMLQIAGQPVYEVRFTGLAAREASRACLTLKRRGRPCQTVAPN